ncbi:peptidase C39-like protein [Tenacibaculum skagerrakense]|uniref:Peptidase C39-like protein n=1 Tax=Tenacibaculum skagerrakense TaxID=186571 RepID=A0A4V2SLW3_9FLAO|nr:vitamin K epoxide reductase family protein [Tenacibaculum skagerrakense]TCP25006.1 peptidase C39-like protein [Tenacibaculum skagerrakense]
MKNPLFMIVQRLLSKNKIAHDKKELAFQIKSHPSYPSLHAITGVLDHFNIENVAAEVPTDIQTLHQLPESFIAQVNTDEGTDLVTVIKVKNKPQYSIYSNSSKDTIVTESEFIQKFTGIIVAVEKTENETAGKEANSVVDYILLFALLGITGFLTFDKIGALNLAHLLLSVFGIIASYSILNQELGESTVIGDAFCSGNSEKKDCDAVLNSKGAEIFKGHKLSDLSIIYFIGLTVASLSLSNFYPVYLISLAALPITLYSIYYQYQVVKSWCTLCLSIVGILWLQASLVFFETTEINSLINLATKDIVITALSFIGTYTSWRYLKPLIRNVIDLRKEKIEAVKFKRNFNLFNTLLQKSPKLNTTIEKSGEIVLGNKKSPVEITVITNPFCGHCKPVHKLVDQIIERYHDNVKVIVRFNVPVDHPDSDGVIVANRLIELYNEQGEKVCMEAMSEIYGSIEYNDWLSKWKKSNDFSKYLEVLQNEKSWCNENGINFTPEILINGKSFPKEYSRTDLSFFIEDLEENYSNIPQHNEL